MTGTTELIWHFAGYLRLPEFDYGTPTIRYDGQAPDPVPGDPSDALPHKVRVNIEGHLPGVHLGPVSLVESNDGPWHDRHVFIRSPLAHPHVHMPHMAPHHQLPPPMPAEGGGGGEELQLQISLTATYQSGGDQEIVDLHQINSMTSNNTLVNHNFNAPLSVELANDENAASNLTNLLNNATDAPGHDIIPIGASSAQLINFINAHDADAVAAQAQHAAYEVQPGLYVNGSLYSGDADPHQATIDALNSVSTALNNGLNGPPAAPTGDGHAVSDQTISVGSNIVANDALLANFEGASVSLAVHGNFYQTEAIVQTNVFQESDHYSGSSASSAQISIAPNTITNVADMHDQSPLLTSGGSGGGIVPSDLNWNVTVLNGSLYDVHSLVQTNYMTNNNVVYESTSTGISQVIAGGNTAANVGQFENLSANYDLIIVEGNYHQANLIYQTNVVLDSNYVGLNGDGTTAQSVTGGGNTVINDASIINTGNYSFQTMSQAALAVTQDLENHQGSLDISSVASAFPNLFGNINVLVVTGDYYDINYLSQTNIISNANTVALDGTHGGANASQTLQTGHDIALNSATIYDAGSATSPYLGGQYSNDMILIQTNIVADGSKITGSDPNQLAPELVAFTSLPEASGAAGTGVISPTVDLQHHASDPMASVLH